MKIMLDLAPEKIAELCLRFDREFWQLRTPLTKNAITDVPYGLDNGCYTTFYEKTWLRLVNEAEANRPVFVCLPDIVGDAQRTIEMFHIWSKRLNGLPKCLVLQDGVQFITIPWNDIDAIFIGGTDAFKTSAEAFAAAKMAKMLGKWVHVGRVNSYERACQWIRVIKKKGKPDSIVYLADSIDGSGMSIGTRDYEQLRIVMDAIDGKRMKQIEML